MTSLAWLIPAALTLGLMGLGGFLWALRSGQFEDLEGAGWRAIEDGEHNGMLTQRRLRSRAEAVDLRAALYIDRALAKVSRS